jgi:hypothetical protein
VRLLFSKRQFSCAPATLRVQGHAPTLAAGEQSGRRPTEFSPPDVPRGGISLLRHRPAPGKNLKILCRISQEMGFDLPILPRKKLQQKCSKGFFPLTDKIFKTVDIQVYSSNFMDRKNARTYDSESLRLGSNPSPGGRRATSLTPRSNLLSK